MGTHNLHTNKNETFKGYHSGSMQSYDTKDDYQRKKQRYLHMTGVMNAILRGHIKHLRNNQDALDTKTRSLSE